MKQGILLVDKPVDWTSFDVVNYVRRIVADKEGVKPKSVKVGHAGTLDPFATGLLILLIGKEYTKRAEEFTKQDKVYTFSLKLGEESTTGDSTGEITHISDTIPTKDQVLAILNGFRGPIQQIPPQFSAIKINGQRAYNLARRGEVAVIEPRQVTIHSLELDSYNYPIAVLTTNVSSGTYIRSLGEDIGKALGTGAFVEQLRRESISKFSVDGTIGPKEISKDNIEQLTDEVI